MYYVKIADTKIRGVGMIRLSTGRARSLWPGHDIKYYPAVTL